MAICHQSKTSTIVSWSVFLKDKIGKTVIYLITHKCNKSWRKATCGNSCGDVGLRNTYLAQKAFLRQLQPRIMLYKACLRLYMIQRQDLAGLHAYGVHKYTWGSPSKASRDIILSYNKSNIINLVFTRHWTVGSYERRLGIKDGTDCLSCGLASPDSDFVACV